MKGNLTEQDLEDMGFSKQIMTGTGWRTTRSMCDPIYYYQKGRLTINATHFWTWFLDGNQRNDLAVYTKAQLVNLLKTINS